MMVSLVEGIGDIVPRKPKVIIQQEIRYKERVVYKDRPSVKTKSKSKPKPKPKFKPKPASSLESDAQRSGGFFICTWGFKGR